MRTEERIQAAIVAYLRAVLPTAVVMAIPNAARRTKGGHARNGVPGLLKGAPDLVVALPSGRAIWLEVKSDTGVISPEQRGIGLTLQALQHGWAIVRSVDDVRRALAAWEIDTREAA